MRKTNNKGFSMTEVIVAVAVFLILAIPILSQLVLSVKNNSKAKASQYGINVAESEMELFKSVDLNALVKIYDHSDDLDASGALIKTTYTLPGIYLDPDGKIIEAQFMSNPYATSSLMEFAQKVQTFVMDKDGVCTFAYNEVLSNEEYAGSGKVTDKEFEVTVTLNPTAYDGDSGELNYNSPKDGAVQNLNKDEQAIIGSNLDYWDDEARRAFWEEGILPQLTHQEMTMYGIDGTLPPNFRQYSTFSMHRTTYITIEENPDTSVTSGGAYVVSTRYQYDCKYKIGSNWFLWSRDYYDDTEQQMYYNTVPDVKYLYNQLVVERIGTSQNIFSDSVVFTNKLDYEQKHVDGFSGSGYEYYYTNSDLYIVFNNDPSSGRVYSNSVTCDIDFGANHNSTQTKLNVYYSQVSDAVERSITNNLKPLDSDITIQSADMKVVQQDFQPIYDIKIQVTPSNGNGMTTKMEGTRGQ